VNELLAERGITPDKNDLVRPETTASIGAGDIVSVIRVGNDRVVVEETIKFSERLIYDSSQIIGARTVQTAGVLGSKLVTYQVVYENDQEISRQAVGEVILSEPKEAVVVVGTKPQDPSSNIAIGQTLAADRGWTGAEWGCLYELWMRESRWNHLASNPNSGAYGIPQALPGSKMSSIAGDWQTNPATQISWGLNYVAVRYGSPCQAWYFFLKNNWY
jgi:hypothetical protein